MQLRQPESVFQIKQHEYWMAEALKEAEKAFRMDEIPVGCVILREQKIIASAHNLCESAHDPTAHAEILAIRKACTELGTNRLSECVMYVTLEPCPMCAGALMAAQLKACYYGLKDERQGCCASVYALLQDPAFYHHVYCYGGILKQQSAELLQQFFLCKRLPEE